MTKVRPSIELNPTVYSVLWLLAEMQATKPDSSAEALFSTQPVYSDGWHCRVALIGDVLHVCIIPAKKDGNCRGLTKHPAER